MHQNRKIEKADLTQHDFLQNSVDQVLSSMPTFKHRK